MRKTHYDKGNSIRYAIIALLIVFLLSAALLLLEIWEKQRGRFPELEFGEDVILYNGKEYIKRENIETFLVLGLDKFEGNITNDSYNNDQQADFLMLFIFDNDQKKCTAIHINRDTMASMNILGVAGNKIDTVVKQIALSHTYGNGKEVSCRNTAESVSELLYGVKVNHYISVTMDSVPIFNDLVGGVEVTVEDDFSEIDPTLVKGQKVTLLGKHALNFIRSRSGLEDSTNSTRMIRQKQYLQALFAKTQERIASDPEFVIEASVKMSEYMISDRSVTQLQELARKFNAYEFDGIRNIKGDSRVEEELAAFYPDRASLKKMIVELFYTPKT